MVFLIDNNLVQINKHEKLIILGPNDYSILCNILRVCQVQDICSSFSYRFMFLLILITDAYI